MSYQFRWDVILHNWPFLLSGLEMTLLISAVALVGSVIFGLVLAVMDLSEYRALRWIAGGIGELIRNTPILVQLLWVYYVLPMVFDVQISAFAASVLGLTVYSSAFIAEVYRAGIQSVPIGHREAAQVLGMSRLDSFTRIVMPQAIKAILPPMAANFVQLIKYSSLASVLSVAEITRRATELASSTFRPLEIFTFVAVVYFVICWPLAWSIRVWERRLRER